MEARGAADQEDGGARPLEGLPRRVSIPGGGTIEAGPSPRAKSAAADYMASTGRAYDPPRDYVKVDPERAARIASAFEEMKDDPTDPRVLASYKAMIDETLAQWEAIKKTGLHVEFIKGEDPYAASPRLAIEDVNRNNHLWVFPTDAGYGSSEIMAHEIERNPLLALTGETISGQPARANDIFRIVHDYFGHIKEGVGFRADGEENAWRQHAAMYSDLARGAMTTETRGQNSWLNFGPHGEANRTAKSDETVFADQKIGLMPKWVEDEGRFQRREETETPEFKAWFGGSKVVDANGDPQVLYHGTITHGSDKEFGNVDVFDRNFAKNYFGRKSSFNEVGSWFSSKPDKSGAGMYSGASGGHIYPVFVRIENPKETSLSQLIRTARRLAGLDPDRAPNGKPIGVFDPEPYRKWLKDNGYDGIRLTRDESGELSKQDVWVALEPNQIKSATGNSGAFDRNNPDIRFQRRRTPQEIDADERVRLAKVANRVALISKPWDALMSTGPVKNLMAGDAYAKSAEAWKSFSRAVKLFADPMTVGGFDPARAAAKDFMNQQRRIQYAYSKLDDMILNGAVDKQTGRRITNGFSAAERKLMWEATDEQSVFEQKLKADLANVAPADQAAYEAQARQGFAGRGLDRLTGDQRAVAEMLNNLAQATWKRLYDAGIVRGEEGLPYYMPRQFVKDVGANGKFERIDAPGGEGGNSSLDKIGGNLQGAGIKSRKHLEVSDTEAAAKAKLGNDAEIVKDVRVLLLALSRAEKGIAGRSLVDSIKALGKLAGATTVQDHEGSEFFTIDHPALKKWGPDFEQDANGKWVPRLDANGQPIMVQKPIYIHRSFEGPLRAVLSKPPGMIYSALMQAKTFGTTMVMLSPFIHLSVIMGKAFPMMRGKMLTMHFWKEGSLALRDDDTMKEAISHGYVPIGHGGFRQDITGIANEPGSRPGNSIIAKGTGLLGRPFGMAAEDAIRNGVDKVGHFVHGTLLWDRIAQLQAGIYTTIRDKYMDAGYSRDAAAYAAAHIANRYAGVLPKEAMGDLAGKVANVMMFSRSFTLGNLGIMKDMGVGLPMDVRSQMKRDIPGLMGSSMSAQIRRKSIGGFVADIAMLYAMNAALQTGIQMLWHDQTLDDVAKGFIDRANRLGQRVAEHPLDMINPFDMADSIMPGGDNEPGKESRIYIGRDETGRAMYFRNAFGKIGEEFKGWLTTPLTMMHNKSSTLVKPLLQIWQNDKGFGQQVFTPSEGGVTGNIKTLGQAVGHFMKSQMGTTGDIGSSVYDMFDGVIDSNHKVDKVAAIKAWLPILTGLTVSQGHPAGPDAGVEAAAIERHRQQVMRERPEINKMIKAGDIDGAVQRLIDLGESRQSIKNIIESQLSPQKGAKSISSKFGKIATPEDRERAEEVNQ